MQSRLEMNHQKKTSSTARGANNTIETDEKMRTIDVCLSPDLMHLFKVSDRTVVVVDILRATSCMTTAFAFGISQITPVAKLEDCLALKSAGTFTAGERDGKKVDGFDLGNSPFEYMQPHLKGKSIAFTTTNGTQAIVKSLGAKEIVIGSFLNLKSVISHLQKQEDNILVVCSGWKGKVNLEDSLFAGAVVELMKETVQPECDAPLMAQHLYNIARNDMEGFLQDSSHVKRLARLGIQKDIAFCLTHDQYDVLPVLKDGVLVNELMS
jgi:2-phosphosulfolactate phosphatase